MTEGPRSELGEMAKQKDMTWDLSELANTVSKERKVAVVYTLLAACVSDPISEEPKGKKDKNAGGNSDGADIVIKPGYDARQRVALRLLALWFDIEWAKVVSYKLNHCIKPSGCFSSFKLSSSYRLWTWSDKYLS